MLRRKSEKYVRSSLGIVSTKRRKQLTSLFYVIFYGTGLEDVNELMTVTRIVLTGST